MDPFRGAELFGLSASAIFMIPLLLLAFFVAFLVVYIMGDRKDQSRDPMLGAKVLLAVLVSVSFQIVLLGLALLFGAVFDGASIKSATKLGGGPVLGGALSMLYPAVALARVHTGGTSRVFRKSLGINAIVTGIVWTIALSATFAMWINESEGLAWPVAFTLVYFAGNIACGIPVLGAGQADVEEIVFHNGET